MNVETFRDEIAATIHSETGEAEEESRFVADALMPLVRKAQAEAWFEGADAASDGYDIPDSAQIINPYVRAEDEPPQTEFYEVMGGQGLRRIAVNLTHEEAEQVRRKFDRDCIRAELFNPPTRINQQHGRY